MCLIKRLVPDTLDAIPVPRPRPTQRKRQHLCADKGYDADAVARRPRDAATPTFRARTTKLRPKHLAGKARRWKVERTHSWLNRARRLLIRWEKKVANYLGFLHLQFAIVTLRTAGVLG